MLKTITKSSNKKLGDIASTYRAGAGSVYSTCPNSCPLKPEAEQGSSQIDREYLQAVLDAVPEGGVSWTYTHFHHEEIPAPEASKTTINISTDSFDAAKAAFDAGYPTVIVRPSTESAKVDRVDGLRYVRCPAEYMESVTCKNCGSGRPLCARQGRDYAIKFTAHGSGAKRVGLRIVAEERERQQDVGSPLVPSQLQAGTVPRSSGGCYASNGPVHLQWRRAVGIGQDSEVLLSFVRSLPQGSLIRHHVAGDLG